ncbi:MAG: hypothetical protein ABJB74_03665 [Gemmatimonas sp.]
MSEFSSPHNQTYLAEGDYLGRYRLISAIGVVLDLGIALCGAEAHLELLKSRHSTLAGSREAMDLGVIQSDRTRVIGRWWNELGWGIRASLVKPFRSICDRQVVTVLAN